MEIVTENVKGFKYFPVLPPELQMMIVDEMTRDDRLTFSRCSKYSNALAKQSKKYVYGLELFGTKNFWVIYFVHGEYDNCHNRKIGYSMRIYEKKEIKYKTCFNLNREEISSEELDSSTDLFEYGRRIFIDALKFRQKYIKKLVISGDVFKNFDFEVTYLNSLEDLVIEGNIDIPQFLSKTRPLQKLKIQTTAKVIPLTGIEQIFDVQKSLHLHDLTLNNQQLRRLTATHVRIPIGDLTQGDILDFINSWKNGTIEANVGDYQWDMRHSRFYILEFFRNIEGNRIVRLNGYKKIFSHDHDPNKMATLTYSRGTLRFRWFERVGFYFRNV